MKRDTPSLPGQLLRAVGAALGAAAVPALLLAAPAAGQDLRQEIDAEPGGTLRIVLPLGDIEVDSHDEDVVELDGRASAWGPRRPAFEVERSGDEIRVTVHKGGMLPFLMGGMRLHARVPEHFNLDLTTNAGRIEVEEIEGEVRADTNGGRIEVEQIRGDVRLRTSGGGIRVQEVEGDIEAECSGGRIDVSEVSGEVDARTSGGSIRIRDVGEEVDARTSGGSIDVRFAGPPAGRLETSGGSIDVEIPEGAGLRLDAEATGGKVRIDDELQPRGRQEPDRVEVELNGGGGDLLRAYTSGGSIRVRAR